ncbi:hypothetical protein NELLIE_48 [Arthrobacter phage Nellie]|uniref:Uncharacterized protein n=4 Tax=Jasminevirus adat TaxID=2560299 RepID=A0A249XN87_9CAUD|nr:hypothetical protein FDI47_gp48 [Arthrobacter phage Adat]ASZ72619.1 hypothetical protein ADAT_48 [Arthrobacter phage Adat]ASZ73201.1 hypothetical protein GURGLEFERB_48 [Arthrobacter phage GurgleFerb]ASZ73766.1 hypothetical protein NELLIE_48 [Arthrobacter phage Nellie]AXH43736.1 hypothetical protein SEA_BRAD_48 [Arthrobacter phage Brad]
MAHHRGGGNYAKIAAANETAIRALISVKPMTYNELAIQTGLTVQTIRKRIRDMGGVSQTTTTPMKFYMQGAEDKSFAEEMVDKHLGVKKTTSAAEVVFFPQATDEQRAGFHKFCMEIEPIPVGDVITRDQINHVLALLYKSVSSEDDLTVLEHGIKSMYDAVQFRKEQLKKANK